VANERGTWTQSFCCVAGLEVDVRMVGGLSVLLAHGSSTQRTSHTHSLLPGSKCNGRVEHM
jgi:hypothetical protein